LKDSESRGIGIVMNHVGTEPDERECRFTSSGGVLEGVDVDEPCLGRGVHGLCTCHPSLVRRLDGRKLDPSDEADDAASGHSTRGHPGEIARLFEAEDHRGHHSRGAHTGRDDEHGLRIVGRDAFGHVLELESVTEDQVVPLGGVCSESLLLGPGCLRLHVAHLDPQAVPDLAQPLVGS
jgi:hypothetical protein